MVVSLAISGSVKERPDLEIWVRGHSRSLNWYHSKAWVHFPIRLS